ncbi:MAG: flagellar protein FlaG [Aquificota bacterium]|nr:MAG: flagellar protein FlaG [Aquificota bacterium]
MVQKQAQEGALERMKREREESVHQSEAERRVNSQELQKLMEEIKRKFDMLSKYLRIDIDSELEIPVAKIIEKDTNRVIRQIPPEYLLDLMKKIDQLLGILLNKEA